MNSAAKREAMNKKYYKAIKEGKFDLAKKLLNQMVEFDVKSLAKKLGK